MNHEPGGKRSSIAWCSSVADGVLLKRMWTGRGVAALTVSRKSLPSSLTVAMISAAERPKWVRDTCRMAWRFFSADFANTDASVITLIALLVSLIPTTIGALLSAIGIAGMDRLVRRNVLALSGRAVEASGDVDLLLLDKTGTITLGNREATALFPMPGVEERELAEVAQFSSLADETPEGRSIVVLAKRYGIREHHLDVIAGV